MRWHFKYKRCHYSTIARRGFKKLKERVRCLEDKVVQLEIKNNSLEQYGRRNNLEIEVIPTSISDDELEKTTVGILNSMNVNLDSSDVEACHRIGRSKDGKPKKTIIHIINWNSARRLYSTEKKLSLVDINDDEIQLKNKVFVNENLNSILLQEIKEGITSWH